MIRSSSARRAPSPTASTPPTRRRRPSSASSPHDACSARRARGSWCDAASSARAMGRSNHEPSFLSTAGARLTVMRLPGNSSSASDPCRTRCFFLTARSAGRRCGDGLATLNVRLHLDSSRLEAYEQGHRARTLSELRGTLTVCADQRAISTSSILTGTPSVRRFTWQRRRSPVEARVQDLRVELAAVVLDIKIGARRAGRTCIQQNLHDPLGICGQSGA